MISSVLRAGIQPGHIRSVPPIKPFAHSWNKPLHQRFVDYGVSPDAEPSLAWPIVEVAGLLFAAA
jgi:hypothetical protein